MNKLTRKSAKLFAENATAQAGGVAQFGSLAAGTPNYSKDPDVIQGLQQYSDGWSAAVLGTKSPALEDRNALDYLLSYQQAYLMQRGIPEWLSTETYYKDCYVVDSNGVFRRSLIDNNTNHNPATDTTAQYWDYGPYANLDLSNLTATGEAHFAKPDLSNATAVHIVETYHSGTDWYRVWSDGWCEQGGEIERGNVRDVEVTLLKPYADTNYFVHKQFVGGPLWSQADAGWWDVYDLTTTSFKTSMNTSNGLNKARWRACGYISL